MEPLKEYKISEHWFTGKRQKKTTTVAFNMEEALARLKAMPQKEPPPPALLTIEQRQIRLKKLFDYFAQLMTGDGYEYTEKIKPLLRTLTDYFMGVECGLDLSKGVLIIGEPGRGKSWIMEIWAKTLRSLADAQSDYHECKQAFHFARVKALVSQLQSKEGETAYQTEKLWLHKIWSPHNKELPFHACLDDIYKEEDERSYKYNQNPMPDIYNARDKHFVNHGLKLHGTANFHPDEMEMYSDALRDRFYQMFNILHLEGQSFRRK